VLDEGGMQAFAKTLPMPPLGALVDRGALRRSVALSTSERNAFDYKDA